MQALAQDPKERLDIDALDDTFARILDEARDLALGTMDVPATASTPATDLDADEAWFRNDDEATWIDQLPRRDTPTSHPTLIGTLAPMQTPPLGVPQYSRPAPFMMVIIVQGPRSVAPFSSVTETVLALAALLSF